MTDPEIISNILSGNINQYSMLVEKYKVVIFRTCMGYVHDEDEANDLTQETFIHAYQKLDTFRNRSKFSTWLYRIAINLSLNHQRRKRRNLFDRIENAMDHWSQKRFEIQESDSPEELLISNQNQQIIHSAIDKLPENQRTAFILSKYEEKTQKEIAEIMQLSEGAVEQLLQRSKTSLRKTLSKYFK